MGRGMAQAGLSAFSVGGRLRGVTMAGIRFDGTVTLGNLLTALGMLLPALYWGTTVETRLAEKAAIVQELERRIDRDAKVHSDALAEIKSGIRRIEDKLDAKADKQK